jgi:hypothetical protein
MERESVLHIISHQQSFEALPLKPVSQIKTWVRTTKTTRTINLHAWVAQWSSLPEASGTRPSSQIDGTSIQLISS